MTYTWKPISATDDMDLVYAMNAALGTEYDPRHSLTRIELSGSIYSQRSLIDRHRLTHKTTNILFFADPCHVVCDNGFEKFSFDTRTIVTTEGACRVVLHFKDDESLLPNQEMPRIIYVKANPSDFIPVDAEEIEVGMRVLHQKFGQGTVVKVEGIGPNKKASVDFDEGGNKMLMLKFAKLSILKQ